MPQSKLQMRERFLDAILQSAIDFAIISLDLDGLVTSWNEGARRILGWADTEMIGRPAADFFTEEDRCEGIPQKEMIAALTSGRGVDERWHLRKDGSLFWASGEMMALRDDTDKVLGFLKILRDRTQQRLDEERRRADAEFLQKVLSSSDDCIEVLDLDARLTFVSEGGLRALELADASLIEGINWAEFWSGDDRQSAIDALNEALLGKSARFTSSAARSYGTARRWDVQVSPIMNALGEPERVLCVSRDITALKAVQDNLQLIMQESAHRVKNTLSVVQAIISQSLKHVDSVGEATAKIQARIGAVAKAHDTLLKGNWHGATIRQLFEIVVANTGMTDGGRVILEGPEITLNPNAALSLNLVAHEMMTNAIKYGALSTETGGIHIAWNVACENGQQYLHLEWDEHGGPPVVEPTKKGFGSKLIAASLTAFGEADVLYSPSGMQLRVRGPLTNVSAKNEFVTS